MYVCITIDTEFSIAGSFSDTNARPVAEPAVWCDVDGRSEGLGFLLSCFKRFHVPATFFVEVLHRHYFKHDPMLSIVSRILEEGHEVQLHAHPCWSVFKNLQWRERLKVEKPNDRFYGRSVEDSIELLQEGLDVFRTWGLPRPKVFRSGNLHHDDTLYAALTEVGIPYSSNVGLAIFDSGDPRYQLYSGVHKRHSVLEMPVLTFTDWCVGRHKHLKTLTICGTSSLEMQTLLERAYEAGISLVVILTHPFEFVQSKDLRFREARRHSINQQRLTRLCEYLDRHRDRFTPVGMAHAADAEETRPSPENVLLKGVLWQGLSRMATQVLYDNYGNWLLSRKGVQP